MSEHVHLAEVLDGDQCVDLRRRDRRVAEQLLHNAYVGAAVEQMRRVRVAQRVRRHARRVEPGGLGRAPQDRPRRLAGQAAAASIEEHRRCAPAGRGQTGTDAHEVGVQRGRGVRADRYEPGLPALAAQRHACGSSRVDVVAGQRRPPRRCARRCRRGTRAARGHAARADRRRRIAPRIARRRRRPTAPSAAAWAESAAPRRGSDRRRETFPYRESVKPAHRADGAGRGRRGQRWMVAVALAQRGQIGRDLARRDRRRDR